MSDPATPKGSLRAQAEAHLAAQAQRDTAVAKDHDRQSLHDSQRLVHELQVHQIELELQNEELQQARAQLEASLAAYTDLYDFSPVGYLTLDRQGTIHRANLMAAQLLYTERARLMGDRLGLHVVESSRADLDAFLGRIFAGGKREACELVLCPQGGGRSFVRLTGQVTAGGVECHGVLVDMTVARLLEEQLRRAQKMEAVGQLAGGVAHDFNNLLSVIVGYAALAQEQAGREGEIPGHLRQVRLACERAALLTRQLLAFSATQPVAPVVLDVNQLAGEVQQLLQRLLGEQVALATQVAPGEHLVKAGRGQIEQLLINLAINARDAMPQGGPIQLAITAVELDDTPRFWHLAPQPGPHVCISVTDTGHGMSGATLARLFEPLFTTKESGKGTGIGLATVYAIVRQCGGGIAVRSAPGQGSCFEVYLPRVLEGGAAAAVTPVADLMVRGQGTVLVVEDEEAVRTVMQRVLEVAGYTVVVAAHGQEALAICEARDGAIDLVLSDVVMPTMDGPMLAEQLAARYPGLRLLFMSGYADVSSYDLGRIKGAHFIAKPCNPYELTAKVRAVLDGATQG